MYVSICDFLKNFQCCHIYFQFKPRSQTYICSEEHPGLTWRCNCFPQLGSATHVYDRSFWVKMFQNTSLDLLPPSNQRRTFFVPLYFPWCFLLPLPVLSPSPSCSIFWIKLMLRLMRGKRKKKGENSSLRDNCVAAPSAAGMPLYWLGLTPLYLHLLLLKKQVLPDLQKTYLGLLRFLLPPMWDTTMSIT